MRVALAQVNPTVGDLSGNRRLVEEAAAKAAGERADLVVLPEMVLTGYPPMDLLERDGFVRDQLRELDALLPASERVAIALGAVLPNEEKRPRRLSNAAVLLAGGRRVAVRAKSLLATYDVFDEPAIPGQIADRVVHLGEGNAHAGRIGGVRRRVKPRLAETGTVRVTPQGLAGPIHETLCALATRDH